MRPRAYEFLKNHDVFYIAPAEYLRECRIFERNFAGIVLGRCANGVEIKIMGTDEMRSPNCADMLPLGCFGEIAYKKNEVWQKTGFYGFIDDRDRVWCCGKIENTVFYGGEYFYPDCIAPAFETLFFVKSAKLIKREESAPGLAVKLRLPFRLKFLRKILAANLRSFADRFEKTKKLSSIAIENVDDSHSSFR
jgi:hypothetical protein